MTTGNEIRKSFLDYFVKQGHTVVKSSSLVPEKDFFVWIGNGEGKRCFRTTPEWCSQVNEFKDIYTTFCHPTIDIKVEVHGAGMLPHMWTLMKAKHAAGLIWDENGNYVEPHDDVAEQFPSTQPLEEMKNANASQ